ncbi:MAG: lysophospholipid acyltransferase family protein [Akkermansiaceae bacterium]|nr:lysophospholipid acyltransferase family protein [Akkermansiaceae bacterium]MCF7733925.1 lysophospholipid acyltransferase family protein [Akkermansiaceae bacterium]
MSTQRRTEIRDSRKAMVLGTLAGWAMRVWSWLVRLEVETRWDPAARTGPVIFALWHNRFFTVPPAFRKAYGSRRKCVVLTSASLDGAVVARAMAVFGFGAVRGSSSRRGVAALVGLTRAVRSGLDVCITPDGPRGPRYVFQPGMVKLAEASGTPIIPVHVTFSSAWRFKTWDRFVVPKPFSRVRVVFDHPLTVATTSDAQAFENERARVEAALVAGVDDL